MLYIPCQLRGTVAAQRMTYVLPVMREPGDPNRTMPPLYRESAYAARQTARIDHALSCPSDDITRHCRVPAGDGEAVSPTSRSLSLPLLDKMGY